MKGFSCPCSPLFHTLTVQSPYQEREAGAHLPISLEDLVICICSYAPLVRKNSEQSYMVVLPIEEHVNMYTIGRAVEKEFLPTLTPISALR